MYAESSRPEASRSAEPMTSIQPGSVTDRVVKYVTELRYDQLDGATVQAVKDLTLDTLSALFAAWPTEGTAPQILGDYVLGLGGVEECTLFGRDRKVPAAHAALVNGTMGYAADIEGGILSPPPVHVAASGIPTAIGMAERQAASGRDFISAVVAGYDVADRISKLSATSHSYPHSFHPSAIFGTFGSVVMAGKLLGLSEKAWHNALGLAGNNASGLITWVNDPTEHSRPHNNGRAAHNGVTYALLAQAGFGGPQQILDHAEYSIYHAYSGRFNEELADQPLGEQHAIHAHDGYKKYPCCYDIHTGLDALTRIMQRHQLSSRDIERIDHHVSNTRRRVIDDNPLRSHNAQYIMSVMAVRGELTWDDFLQDRREDPEIDRLYRSTRLFGSQELFDSGHHEPAIVEVTTTSGQTYSERVDLPLGHLKNPMTRDDLLAKYQRFSHQAVGASRADAVLQLVDGLEEVADLRELTALLGA